MNGQGGSGPLFVSSDFMRTCQILKSLGVLREVVTHKAVNDKLSKVCQKSTPNFNAITNTKNTFTQIAEFGMSYRDVFRPCLRISSGEIQNITIQKEHKISINQRVRHASKKSRKYSNGKSY